jgi:hypothetical protein
MKWQSRPRVEHLEARVVASSLAVSILTNRATYRAGDIVYMKLTEKNVSGENITVGWGPSISGFSITRMGSTAWRSNPGIAPLFIVERTLAPGQSITLRAHWKAARHVGTYEVHSQMTPRGPIARFRVVQR